MTPYIILFLGWAVYFTLHSVLASPGVKQKYNFRGYRVVYTLISIIGLLLLLFYNGGIEAAPFFISTVGPLRYVSLVLTTLGVMIIQRSFTQYSFRGFIGIATETAEFKSDGILKHVRHPIYAGLVLVTFGFFLFIPNLPTLISCLCVLVYIPIGIALEEKKLVAMFGDVYIEYRKKVPALLPNVL